MLIETRVRTCFPFKNNILKEGTGAVPASSEIYLLFNVSWDEFLSLRQILRSKIWRDLAVLQSKTADPPYRIEHVYVYILLNKTGTRTYTGVAEDVNERLSEHNSGRVKSSSPYRPYRIIHSEPFETLKEARQKERFYKSTTGRRRLKEMFFK